MSLPERITLDELPTLWKQDEQGTIFHNLNPSSGRRAES